MHLNGKTQCCGWTQNAIRKWTNATSTWPGMSSNTHWSKLVDVNQLWSGNRVVVLVLELKSPGETQTCLTQHVLKCLHNCCTTAGWCSAGPALASSWHMATDKPSSACSACHCCCSGQFCPFVSSEWNTDRVYRGCSPLHAFLTSIILLVSWTASWQIFSPVSSKEKESEVRNTWSFEKINGRRVGPCSRVKHYRGEILPKTAGDVLWDTLQHTTERSPLCKPCVYYGTE